MLWKFILGYSEDSLVTFKMREMKLYTNLFFKNSCEIISCFKKKTI